MKLERRSGTERCATIICDDPTFSIFTFNTTIMRMICDNV